MLDKATQALSLDQSKAWRPLRRQGWDIQGDTAGARVLCGASSRSTAICLLGYFRLPEAPRGSLQPYAAQGREQSLQRLWVLFVSLWLTQLQDRRAILES